MSPDDSSCNTLLSFLFPIWILRKPRSVSKSLLLALMTILSQSLLALVSGHLVAFLLFSVWHSLIKFKYIIQMIFVILPLPVKLTASSLRNFSQV